jgi:predicted PhzF superfamily epimerase YddE/YHI9
VIVQECGVGLVDVRQEGETLAFRAPPLVRSGPLDPADRAEAIRIAGVAEADVVAAVHANNGPDWHLLHLVSAEAVLAARPVPTAPIGTDVGLVGPWGEGHERQFEVRAFFADANGRLVEDPVTGSLNASVAQYLLGAGLTAAPGYRAGQDAASVPTVTLILPSTTAGSGSEAGFVARNATLTLGRAI